MQPIRLSLPSAVAARWPDLLGADGFRLREASAPDEFRLICGGAEHQVKSWTSTAGGVLVDTTRIRDARTRRHVQAILRASGAEFTVPGLPDEPADGGLYRCELRALDAALVELRGRGARADLQPRPPFCGGAEEAPRRFWSGAVQADGTTVLVDTGPCLDPRSGEARLFLVTRPQYRLLPARALLDLLRSLNEALLRHGATRIAESGL